MAVPKRKKQDGEMDEARRELETADTVDIKPEEGEKTILRRPSMEIKNVSKKVQEELTNIMLPNKALWQERIRSALAQVEDYYRHHQIKKSGDFVPELWALHERYRIEIPGMDTLDIDLPEDLYDELMDVENDYVWRFGPDELLEDISRLRRSSRLTEDEKGLLNSFRTIIEMEGFLNS